MICVSDPSPVVPHARGMVWLLLVWLATPGSPDFAGRLLEFAASHQLGPRLGIRQPFRPSLGARPMQDLAVRVQQLAALKLEMEAVASLASASTSAERAELAARLLPQFQQLNCGLPTGVLVDGPHLPFTTYLELSALLYRKVSPAPALVDEVYARFREERSQGSELEEAAAGAARRLGDFRPKVAAALGLGPADPRVPRLELELWGSYFESRCEHEDWLLTWEAQTRSLFLLLLTHLAEAEAGAYPGPSPKLQTPAARAGQAAGRDVRSRREDLEVALDRVAGYWKPAYKPQFTAFLQGYVSELRAAPGPLYRGAGYSLQAPYGWLLQTTAADLHLMDATGETQFSVWSHQESETMTREAVLGLVDARLRADENLADVQGPRPFAAGASLWEARQPALGTTWRLVSVRVAPAPCTTWLILIATAPPPRAPELEPLLATLLKSLKAPPGIMANP